MISPAYEVPVPEANCERREPRTNLFVLATLIAHGSANRIKVRNISPSGALIEGTALPREGAAVSLCRGEVTLTGRIVWSAANRAGLNFDGRAQVSQWLPNTNSAQREVDREVALAKAERSAGILPSASAAPVPSSVISPSDLTAMAALLNQLADELASDPAVVSKYMSKLQILDIAGQALAKCAQDRIR